MAGFRCFSHIASVLSAARKPGWQRLWGFSETSERMCRQMKRLVFLPDARIGDTESHRCRAVRSLAARCHLEATAALCLYANETSLTGFPPWNPLIFLKQEKHSSAILTLLWHCSAHSAAAKPGKCLKSRVKLFRYQGSFVSSAWFFLYCHEPYKPRHLISKCIASHNEICLNLEMENVPVNLTICSFCWTK